LPAVACGVAYSGIGLRWRRELAFRGLEGGVPSVTLLAQVFHAPAQFLLIPAKLLDDVAKS
jgi:hypothetical protein